MKFKELGKFNIIFVKALISMHCLLLFERLALYSEELFENTKLFKLLKLDEFQGGGIYGRYSE